MRRGAGLAPSRVLVFAIETGLLVCTDANAPFIAADQRAGSRAEMRAAGAAWQMNFHGPTVQSFTKPTA